MSTLSRTKNKLKKINKILKKQTKLLNKASKAIDDLKKEGFIISITEVGFGDFSNKKI
tara:strand:+ start:326 stop:499 length:174 start_codon:yes stop_codon:yes gene_type:complete